MEHEAEFATYVEQTWGSLVRAAVCLGCSLGEAEDVAQTALVKAYGAWHRVRSADDRDAYVYRILVNSRHDARRRPWRRERASEQLPERAYADPTLAVETTDAIHRALAGLTRVHRDVVVLRYLVQLGDRADGGCRGGGRPGACLGAADEGAVAEPRRLRRRCSGACWGGRRPTSAPSARSPTEAQTATALGVPAGTVKSRLSRALAHLSTDRHLSDLAGGTHHA